MMNRLFVGLWVAVLLASGLAAGVGAGTADAADEPATIGPWQRHLVGEREDQAAWVRHGDINGDGLVDLVSGDSWFENPASLGGSWTRHLIGSPMQDASLVIDLDADGDLDIFGGGALFSGLLAWAENDGAGNLTVHTNIPTGSPNFLQGIATKTGPAGLEIWIVWNQRHYGVEKITVPADPVNTMWSKHDTTLPSQGEAATFIDVDRDGDLDFLQGHMWSRLEADGTYTDFILHSPTRCCFRGGWGENDRLPDRVVAADMNADGRVDVVVAHESDPANTAVWYEQPADPTGEWPEHLIIAAEFPIHSLDVADLDADGDFDVVLAEHPHVADDGRTLVMQNLSGDGLTWGQILVHDGESHHDGTQLADLDGDGDLDIYSMGWRHNRVVIHENLTGEDGGGGGTTTTSPPTTSSTTVTSSTEVPSTTMAPTTTAAPTGRAARWSFGSKSVPGWTLATGSLFNGVSGWQAADGQRRQCGVRNTNADPVLDGFCHATTRYVRVDGSWRAVPSPATWRAVAENGSYLVTVVVGDAKSNPSSVRHSVQVEGSVAHDRVPTSSASRFASATIEVAVTDGHLDLSFDGGTKTKIVSVEIEPIGEPAASTTSTNPVTSSTSTTTSTTTTTTTAPTTTTTTTTPSTTTTTAPTTTTPGGGAADPIRVTFGSRSVAGWTLASGSLSSGVMGWSAPDGQRRQCGVRNTNADKVLDGFCHATTRYVRVNGSWNAIASPATWHLDVANGTYSATVVVGDAKTNPASVAHSVQVEGITVHERSRTSSASRFATATVVVEVVDGRIDLSFDGGTKTKVVSLELLPL